MKNAHSEQIEVAFLEPTAITFCNIHGTVQEDRIFYTPSAWIKITY